jgi:HEAT repeat protein
MTFDRISAIVEAVLGALAGSALGRLLQDQQAKRNFRQALTDAITTLYSTRYRIESAEAVDDKFLGHKQAVAELWEKLLDPTKSESDIDYDRLHKVVIKLWPKEIRLTDELKQKQREALEFFVDVLCDELWQYEQFSQRLSTRVIRQVDDHVTRHKRHYIIRSYLDLACERICKSQQELMGHGIDYVEPVVRKFEERPKREEMFRRRGPEQLADREHDLAEHREEFEEVDLNQYLLAGPDKRIAVVADSGLGKTTLLQELFLRACQTWQDGGPIPVFFTPEQGSGCAEENIRPKVFERLKASTQRLRDNQLRRLASDLLDKEQLLLLFDALDQMRNPDTLAGCLGEITLRQNRIVVTARPFAWDKHRASLSSFAHLSLLEFDGRRIARYYGDRLMLPQLKDFREDFLGVPILARMIIELVAEKGKMLGQVVNRADLYREFVSMWLHRTEDGKVVPDRARSAIHADMRRLAFEALKKNHLGQFPRSFGEQVLATAGRNGEQVLIDLEKLQFVLRFLETGEDTLVFRHRSFQEYLAAEALAELYRTPTDIPRIKKFLLHPNWDESLKFLAGMQTDSSKLEMLLNTLLNPEGNPPLLLYHDHVRVAALCLHEAKVGATQAKEELLSRIDGLFERQADLAFELLTAWGKGAAEERLIGLLSDESAYVRSSAARALGEIRSERAVEHLIGLLKDSEEYVRSSAAKALGRIRDEQAWQPLIVLLDDPDEEVIAVADWALREIEGKRRVERLMRELKAPEEWVRYRAAEVLGKIKDKRAEDPLIWALNDPNWIVRSKAAEALGRIGSERAVEHLIGLLKDSEKYVRSSAAEALGRIKDKRAVEPLISLLKDPDKFLRSGATQALGEIKSKRAVEHLISLLKDSGEYVRPSAAEALGRIKDKRAVEPLIRLLKDPEQFVRSVTAWALGEMRSEQAAEPLILLLKDPVGDVRISAALALGKIERVRAEELLILLLEDPVAYVRFKAAWALGEIRSKQAVEHLILLLKDQDRLVRSSATWALGEIKSERAVAPLILLLRETDLFDRPSVTEALTMMEPTESALAAVQRAYENRDFSGVKPNLLRAIGSLDRALRSKETIEG